MIFQYFKHQLFNKYDGWFLFDFEKMPASTRQSCNRHILHECRKLAQNVGWILTYWNLGFL